MFIELEKIHILTKESSKILVNINKIVLVQSCKLESTLISFENSNIEVKGTYREIVDKLNIVK
jgi:flagellar basal body P-ring protein FlgI